MRPQTVYNCSFCGRTGSAGASNPGYHGIQPIKGISLFILSSISTSVHSRQSSQAVISPPAGCCCSVITGSDFVPPTAPLAAGTRPLNAAQPEEATAGSPPHASALQMKALVPSHQASLPPLLALIPYLLLRVERDGGLALSRRSDLTPTRTIRSGAVGSRTTGGSVGRQIWSFFIPPSFFSFLPSTLGTFWAFSSTVLEIAFYK